VVGWTRGVIGVVLLAVGGAVGCGSGPDVQDPTSPTESASESTASQDGGDDVASDGGVPATSSTGADTSGGATGSFDVDCGTPPLAAVGANFEHTLVATGAEGDVAFAAEGVAGLSLRADGTLDGKPTAAGSFTLEVVATDATGATGQASCELTVREGLAYDPAIDPLGGDYCVTGDGSLLDRIAPGTGDGSPITCIVEPGVLNGRVPAGVEVDPDTCQMVGEMVETRFGAFAFIVEARQNGAELFVPYCVPQPQANFSYTVEVAHSGQAQAATLPILRTFDPEVPLGIYTQGDPRFTFTHPPSCVGGCYFSVRPLLPPAGFDFESLMMPNLAGVNDEGGNPIGYRHDLLMAGPPAPNGVADRPWVFQMSMDYCLAQDPATCPPGDVTAGDGHVEVAIVMIPNG
jgi:hypothetical protein